MENMLNNVEAAGTLQHRQEKDLEPCQKCHSQAYEIHGKKDLIAIANGSTEGQNYFYRQIEERNLHPYLRRRGLSAHQYYKETQYQLTRCGCGFDKV